MVRICTFLFLAFANPALADCRQALALGLDVSGSVDQQEYRLQLDGLAGALQDENVRSALFSLPNTPVTLAVYEWSGPADQHMIADWTAITDQAVLDQFTSRLLATNRTAADPSTAIGSSMVFGAALLARQPDCWTHTLDLSGDGPANTGPRPRDVIDFAHLGPITINALVIGESMIQSGNRKPSQTDDLVGYFESEVIHGQAAFVEQATGFDQFQTAMVRKLLRELQGLSVSRLGSIDIPDLITPVAFHPAQ